MNRLNSVNIVREISKTHQLYHAGTPFGKLISLVFITNVILFIYFIYSLLGIIEMTKPIHTLTLIPMLILFYCLRLIRKEITRLIHKVESTPS